MGSTDWANVSYEVPSVETSYPIIDHVCTWHSQEVVQAADSEMGYANTLAVARAMALTGIDLIVDPATRLTYKGMMIEGVPNLALAIGYTNASWTLKCDLTCDYVCRMLAHMHATGLRQATARNADPQVAPVPLLGLSSGYVQRSLVRDAR